MTEFKPGDLARTNSAAGFAQGHTVVVREVLSGDRVRVSYPGVSNLIVSGVNLRPLPARRHPRTVTRPKPQPTLRPPNV